jgi:hypothetical protein
LHRYGPGSNGGRRTRTDGALPYSPNLTPCDFFLFGHVKGKLIAKQYEMSEDLVSEVRNIIEGIRPDVLKSVFEFWKGRLLDWCNSSGEYVA